MGRGNLYSCVHAYHTGIGSSTHGNCTWYDPELGYALPKHNIHTQQTMALFECKEACEQNVRCLSLNFNKRRGNCHLNNVTKEVVPLTNKTDWEYHQINCGRGKYYGGSIMPICVLEICSVLFHTCQFLQDLVLVVIRKKRH